MTSSEGNDTSSLANTKPPFLCLPLEVRRQIYSHLIPNTSISSNTFFLSGPSTPSAVKFRNDAQPCSPQVLRLNKQIYEEAIREFYGHAQFLIVVRPYASRIVYTFLGKQYVWDVVPPRTLQFVRRVNFTIMLTRAIGPKGVEQLDVFYRNCFRAGEAGSLQEVTVTITSLRTFWIKCLSEGYDERGLLALVKEHFRGLRVMRGVQSVVVDEPRFLRHRGLGYDETSTDFNPDMARILKAVQDELSELRRVMVLPRGASE